MTENISKGIAGPVMNGLVAHIVEGHLESNFSSDLFILI